MCVCPAPQGTGHGAHRRPQSGAEAGGQVLYPRPGPSWTLYYPETKLGEILQAGATPACPQRRGPGGNAGQSCRCSHAGAVSVYLFSRSHLEPSAPVPRQPQALQHRSPPASMPPLLAATRLPGWPPLLPLPSALGPLPSQYQAGGHDEAGKDHRDVEKRRVLVERYQKHRSHRGLQS